MRQISKYRNDMFCYGEHIFYIDRMFILNTELVVFCSKEKFNLFTIYMKDSIPVSISFSTYYVENNFNIDLADYYLKEYTKLYCILFSLL